MFGRAVDTSLGNVWARTYLKTIGKKAKRSLNIQEREPNEKLFNNDFLGEAV